MIIQLKASSRENLCLSPCELLASNNLTLHNEAHGLRHPLGIYTVSVGKVAERFEDVLNQLDQLNGTFDPKDTKWSDKLLREQERLLYALREHIDHCFLVLQCFINTEKERVKNPHVKQFAKHIKNYRDTLGELVNKIKHGGARLCAVLLGDESGSIPGYFLESVHPGGALGPDPSIHKNGLTAFSFTRDLRFHFFNLMHISESLGIAIEKITGNTINSSEAKCDWLARLAQRISRLPTYYYPDEVSLKNPWISYKEVNNSVNLTLLWGDKSPKPVSFPIKDGTHRFGVAVFYKGDSSSRSFKLPYSR